MYIDAQRNIRIVTTPAALRELADKLDQEWKDATSNGGILSDERNQSLIEIGCSGQGERVSICLNIPLMYSQSIAVPASREDGDVEKSRHIAATTVAARKAVLDGKTVIDGWREYEPTLPLMSLRERDLLLEVFTKAHAIVSSYGKT